jgi:hypothetical protein
MDNLLEKTIKVGLVLIETMVHAVITTQHRSIILQRIRRNNTLTEAGFGVSAHNVAIEENGCAPM